MPYDLSILRPVAFLASSLSTHLNQLWLTPMLTFYQPICLILTLQPYARLLAQIYSSDVAHKQLKWHTSHCLPILTTNNYTTWLYSQLAHLTKCKFHISESNSYGSSSTNSTNSSISLGLVYGRTQSLSFTLSMPIAKIDWDYVRSLLCANSLPSFLTTSSLMPRERRPGG